MTEIVTYSLANLPELTDVQIADLARQATLPDSEIDYSDIPPTTEAEWQFAERGRFYRLQQPPNGDFAKKIC